MVLRNFRLMIYNTKLMAVILLISSFSISASFAVTMSAIDSIGVERNGNKILILHKVTYGETLFSVSRKYQVAVDEIIAENAVLKQGLKSGQTIKIPKSDFTSTENVKSIHKVVSGETLFSISKKYGVSVESLQVWNNLKNNSLKAGQTLLVSGFSNSNQVVTSENVVEKPVFPTTSTPVKEQAKTSEKNTQPSITSSGASNNESEKQKASSTSSVNPPSSLPSEWVNHTVKSGETLFSLSSQYDKTVEELIKWNSLSSNNLKSGQILKVGRIVELENKNLPIAQVKNSLVSTDYKIETSPQNTSGGFQNIKQTGLAQLIEGTGDHKKYLVLHREAPIGSVIRVKNQENNLTIFARVVGNLPDTGDNSRLLIKLSQAAYDQLKSVNQRFPVEILF